MKNKTALITGASRGIGRAIAARFAASGYDLVLTCQKNTDLLEELKAELTKEHGVHCLLFTGDLAERQTAGQLFDTIGETGRTVEVLVNNAGISHIGLLQDTSWDEWQCIVGTNLTAVYSLCKEAIPSMIWNHSGKIINISSVWGCVGASCEVAYSATKGGINALTKALAKELAPSGIQVNAIACGAIDTDMNHFLSDQERQNLLAEIPSGRMGTPEEVAHLAWQLADGNEYLTGQVICLDGGWI
ncbi:elongation factor P 5-aminopentanone reductase [Hominifimenecus sp. rT4P-3]|uniref:elongation factor P 5-aminopentanone reductase n=1 Tax=Hominifimenecus sp. rT4P-3 TaxID=3242979 RepID=UPI003DA4AD17